jgi:hypothetical protein
MNHLLPPPFNLARGHILLGKNVVPMLALKGLGFRVYNSLPFTYGCLLRLPK